MVDAESLDDSHDRLIVMNNMGWRDDIATIPSLGQGSFTVRMDGDGALSYNPPVNQAGGDGPGVP